MRLIDIDVSQCRSIGDFYDLLCRAIGAPKEHGGGPDAFVDSMIWGGMNAIEPPYKIRIAGAAKGLDKVRAAILEVIDSLEKGRAWRRINQGTDVDVSMEVVS
jgi:RNAse (barnase) inhibitor barstar